jgi:hypothetical protein
MAKYDTPRETTFKNPVNNASVPVATATQCEVRGLFYQTTQIRRRPKKKKASEPKDTKMGAVFDKNCQVPLFYVKHKLKVSRYRHARAKGRGNTAPIHS